MGDTDKPDSPREGKEPSPQPPAPTRTPKPKRRCGGLCGVLFAVLVVAVAIGAYSVLTPQPASAPQDASTVYVFPDIPPVPKEPTRGPPTEPSPFARPGQVYQQLTSNYSLLHDSHNPHYDAQAKLNELRQLGPMRSVWILPQDDDPEDLEALSLPLWSLPEEGPRRFVEWGRLRITFLTARLVRMEWEKDSQFQDEPTIVFSERQSYLATTTPPSVRVYDEDGDGRILTMKTDYITVRYGDLGGDGSHYTTAPPIRTNTLEVVIRNDRGEEIDTWRLGAEDRQNLGGTIRTLDHTRGPVPVEPGLLSLAGWSLVDDTHSAFLTYEETNATSGFERWAKQRDPPAHYRDLYLFAYAHDYRSCLGDYVQVAGRIPLPPRFAFGVWWSRWWLYSDQELKSLVEDFATHGVPLDNLVIDMDWHLTAYDEMNAGALDLAGEPLGWSGYSWNYTLFPNPPAFFDWCHEQGLHTTLNLHPAAGIQPHEYCYPEMARAMGMNPNTAMHVPFDIVDRKFTRNYLDIAIHPLERDGVDFWWLDHQQAQVTNITNLNPTIWLNHCFFNDRERVRPGQSKAQRGLIFHRWGGLGSHRYQIGFSGDTHSNWNALNFQIFFTSTASNVGFGYWSHDIGGFMDNQPTHSELFTRWVQWGALSPIFRTHAWRQEFLERRIWKYPPYYFNVMREAIHLRYSLLLYLYTEARRSYDTGISMFYPVYYDFPTDERTYHYRTQGMLGESILFAPVTTPAPISHLLAKNDVFLPGRSQKQEWIEWSTLTSLRAGEHSREVAIDEIPLYIKAGSIIPGMRMDSSIPNLAKASMDPLTLNIFPGVSGSSGSYRLYEDDGVSTDYKESAQNAWTQIESQAIPSEESVQWLVTVAATEGHFEGMSSSRSYLVRLVGVPPPQGVEAGGQEISKVDVPLYSGQENSFIHWSMSRDPDHNLMNMESSGWFYDYEHFTLVIATDAYSRSEEVGVTVRWDMDHTLWKTSVRRLHRGWIGARNTVERVDYYWSRPGLRMAKQECWRLPERLAERHPSEWESVFTAFKHAYAFMRQEFDVVEPDDQSAVMYDLIAAHLKHRDPN